MIDIEYKEILKEELSYIGIMLDDEDIKHICREDIEKYLSMLAKDDYSKNVVASILTKR